MFSEGYALTYALAMGWNVHFHCQTIHSGGAARIAWVECRIGIDLTQFVLPGSARGSYKFNQSTLSGLRDERYETWQEIRSTGNVIH